MLDDDVLEHELDELQLDVLLEHDVLQLDVLQEDDVLDDDVLEHELDELLDELLDEQLDEDVADTVAVVNVQFFMFSISLQSVVSKPLMSAIVITLSLHEKSGNAYDERYVLFAVVPRLVGDEVLFGIVGIYVLIT